MVQIDGLYKLVMNDLAPEAMIVKDVDTVLVVTAFIGQVPLVHRLEKDPFVTICTGDYVRVNADEGTVTVTKQQT
jgi:predicted aconitase with swiveling domain